MSKLAMAMLLGRDPNGVFTPEEVIPILKHGGQHIMEMAYKWFMEDGRGAVIFIFKNGRIDKLAYGARHVWEGSGTSIFEKIDRYLPARQCVVCLMWMTDEGGKQDTRLYHFIVNPRDDA
jgi:hypothetical protein